MKKNRKKSVIKRRKRAQLAKRKLNEEKISTLKRTIKKG